MRAAYRATSCRTSVDRLYEAGSLRLRHPRSTGCEAILLNTSGGLVGGDRIAIEIETGLGADVTLTSASAEKIYKSEHASTTVDTSLILAPASRIAWIPQETILFNRARLRRRFDVDLAEDASLIAAELVVFGRAASGEHDISGGFHDSWRVRREGRLVFADETRIEGAINAILARAAVANGAHGSALVLVAQPGAAAQLDLVRAAIDAICQKAGIEGGASLKDGIIIARFVAHSSELLRGAVAAVLGTADIGIPRVWQ